MSLLIFATHPIQYHVPVYRLLQQEFNIEITVVFGSDFSVAGYHDQEFNTAVQWDGDLLSGYQPIFLSHIRDNGINTPEKLRPKATDFEKILDEIQPKAIMLTGYSLPFHRAAFITLLKNKQKYHRLFRAETTDHALDRHPLKTWLRKEILKRFYQQFDKLLYIGQHSEQHYKALGIEDKRLTFSPYCVDSKNFQLGEENHQQLRQQLREKHNLNQEKIVILFSGKLSYRKGPDLLIQAVKELPSELQKKIVVLFLGAGELENALRQQAEAEPALSVIFAGFHNQSQLSPFYHAADLFVLPSRFSETWGLVVNEALHHGLPCVISDQVGCAPDLILKSITGHIFESGSVENLSKTLLKSMDLLNHADTYKNCVKHIEKFSIFNAAQGIAQAYHEHITKS